MPKTIPELEQERAALEQTLKETVSEIPSVQKQLEMVAPLSPERGQEQQIDVAKDAHMHILDQEIEKYKNSVMKVITKEALAAKDVPEHVRPIIEKIHAINNDIARLQMGADVLITQADKERLAKEEQKAVEQSFAEAEKETGTAHTGAPIMHDPMEQTAGYSTDSTLDAETGSVKKTSVTQESKGAEKDRAANQEKLKMLLNGIQKAGEDILAYMEISQGIPSPSIWLKMVALHDALQMFKGDVQLQIIERLASKFSKYPIINKNIGHSDLSAATQQAMHGQCENMRMTMGGVKVDDSSADLKKIPAFLKIIDIVNAQPNPMHRFLAIREFNRVFPDFPMADNILKKYFNV